ncbi:MAG: sodium:proton exchanger [Actinobacteria bacterium]|nr:sodium:proton exchanger [Actinomycetota bacterium]
MAGVLRYTGIGEVALFFVALASLAGLAWAISFSTEALGERIGPAATGVLQATLGNIPEISVVLFALAAGETVVAKTSLLGALFSNALLILGIAIVVGSWRARDGVMRFQARLPNDTATLLLLAIFIIVLLGLSDQVDDGAGRHAAEISAIGAVLLLGVYAVWVWSYLRAGSAAHKAPPVKEGALSARVSIGLILAAGLAATFVSEWLVHAIDPAVEALGISRAFTGLVIVAIAGNAVENAVAVTSAWKGKHDLALSVVNNAVSQTAVVVFPMLVLLSFFFTERLTFVLDPVYSVALVLTALSVWQMTGDGEAVAFEGYALIALFTILGALTWYA